MAGGHRATYEHVRRTLEMLAAIVDGKPCAAWVGNGAAGHFVKTVHNGIEYALMQVIAESYDLLKRGLGLTDDRLAEVYGQWNQGPMAGFLLEITADIFGRVDPISGRRLIDVVLDEAAQKGTGAWAAQAALDLGTPAPIIASAVAMRDFSSCKPCREARASLLAGPPRHAPPEREEWVESIAAALAGASLLSYIEGFGILAAGSKAHNFDTPLPDVAQVWRGGCIIRSAMLELVGGALQRGSDDLLSDDEVAAVLRDCQQSLRRVVSLAAMLGLPVAAMSTALAWYDSSRSDWLPANLIQAQRDYFGSHTYKRTDRTGAFHTRWTERSP
jgi:6-phosphogluconate dehydrogenase